MSAWKVAGDFLGSRRHLIVVLDGTKCIPHVLCVISCQDLAQRRMPATLRMSFALKRIPPRKTDRGSDTDCMSLINGLVLVESWLRYKPP